MAGQNKASMRKKLRSALAHKKLADGILDSILLAQSKWNTTLDKLNADAGSVTPAVAASALLDLTNDITLTSVASGAARNTTTFTLQVAPPAANPTDTILADFTGTASAIICTITPNDGTNNTLTPVDLTTAQLTELINSGAVVGKTVTIVDISSLRALQTGAGGNGTILADGGEGDGVVATFAGGVTGVAGLDTNYVASGAIAAADIFTADSEVRGAQHMATWRKSLRSALAHRKLADEIIDAIEEMQTAYNALLAKLDAEAGTLNDGNYASLLALAELSADAEGLDAQHKASYRKSLHSALANAALADDLLAAIIGWQSSFNAALAVIDTAAIHGAMAAFKVAAISPDAE